MACFAFSYGVLSTYVAIYGKEELGISGGSALFFMLLSIGLILSRLVGSRTLRQGKITQNAAVGMTISVFGYLMFAALHNPDRILWRRVGYRSGQWTYVAGLSNDVYQLGSSYATGYGQFLGAHQLGYRRGLWGAGWWCAG